MRLQTKKEATAALAIEKRLQIDEGKRIADRVDKLRELSAQEEANFHLFRDQSLALLKEEIQEHTEYISQLEKEVEILEVRKQEALVPINAQKEEADRILQETNSLLLSNQEKEQILLRNDGILTDRLKDVSERESVCDNRDEVLVREVRTLETDRQAFSERVQEFNESSTQKTAELITREKAVVASEKSVSYRENDIGIREELAVKQEQKNKDKDTELRRRFQSLESSIASMEKKFGKKLKI